MDYSDYMMSMQQDDESLGPTDLIAAYEQGIDQLNASVSEMTAEQLLARPIPGKWSTQEVVSHLADTEIYFSDRIERTLALERPLLIGVDERSYPDRLKYQAFELVEQLDLFAALRRHVARILRNQPEDAWQRTAVHSETGMVTVRRLVLQAIRHLRHHLPFIAEKRKALQAVQTDRHTPIAAPQKVNLAEKLAMFNEQWTPKIVGELNGQSVKLVKFQGEFIWHKHDHEDELFLVVDGEFRMDFRDRQVLLRQGEFLIVPRGIEHRPVAEREAHVLLFEPSTTLNTGNVQNDRTVSNLERI